MKNLITILKLHNECTTKEEVRLNLQLVRFEFFDDYVKLVSINGCLLLISEIKDEVEVQCLKNIFKDCIIDSNIINIHKNEIKIILNQLKNNLEYTVSKKEGSAYDDFVDYNRAIPKHFDVNEFEPEVLHSLCQDGVLLNLKYLSYICPLESIIGNDSSKSDGLKIFQNNTATKFITYEATTDKYKFLFILMEKSKN